MVEANGGVHVRRHEGEVVDSLPRVWLPLLSRVRSLRSWLGFPSGVRSGRTATSGDTRIGGARLGPDGGLLELGDEAQELTLFIGREGARYHLHRSRACSNSRKKFVDDDLGISR